MLGLPWHQWGCCSNTSENTLYNDADVLPDLENLLDFDLLSEMLDNSASMEVPSVRMTEPSSEQRGGSHYALPKTDNEIKRARAESVPKNTRKDTAYCFRIWTDWEKNSHTQTNEIVPSLMQLTEKSLLQHWLTRLVLEIRTKKGTEYTPNTLHHIVCGIMRYIRQECGKSEILRTPSLPTSELLLMLK